MSKSSLILIAVGVLFIVPKPTYAQQIIAQCGASKGKALYSEPRDTGWVDDGISGGTITFMRDAAGKFDVILKDAAAVFSVREDGATVAATHFDEKRLTLVVAYPTPVVEVYQLSMQSNGKGTLLWSSSKNGSGAIKTTRIAAFKSECSK